MVKGCEGEWDSSRPRDKGAVMYSSSTTFISQVWWSTDLPQVQVPCSMAPVAPDYDL